jgi:drug/metabolite transporter (DMT)-like permease
MTDNLRGILLMVAAMAIFAVEDTLIKSVAPVIPLGQVLTVSALFGLPFFAILARREGVRLLGPLLWHPTMIGRNLGEMVGTAGYVISLSLIPLTTTVAIFQAMPLAVTAMAAIFLAERVGWRRWTAIGVGFLGVLIVIRPDTGGLNPGALWAILSVIGLSVRDICTRAAPKGIPTVALAAWGYGAILILGLVMLALPGGGWVWPDPWHGLMLGGIVLCGMTAYALLTAATRMGEISAIMPFRYSRLVVALILGGLVFGERPDLVALAGMALIIGAGLYAFARERALSKRSPPG